jgi:beta-glucosidase
MSFPESVGQVPVYYNCDNTGRPYESDPDEKYVSKYLDVSNYAKYPFGFGLSYSQFDYESLILEDQVMTEDRNLRGSVRVTNQSDVAGVETVQLYIYDKVGQVTRPVKELKEFYRVALAAKTSQVVAFEIDESMLQYVHTNQKMSSDSGEFELLVGPNSRDLLKVTFALKKNR